MKTFLSNLLTKAEPLLLDWSAALLRRYIGLGNKLWTELNKEIDALDADKLLTNEQRHSAAVVWLRATMALPDQGMPRFYLRPDWEGRAIQLTVLIRRLRAWLNPEPLI